MDATEAPGLGKAQRGGTCRKSGDLPDFLLKGPFVGKASVALVHCPQPPEVGFFCACQRHVLLYALERATVTFDSGITKHTTVIEHDLHTPGTVFAIRGGTGYGI